MNSGLRNTLIAIPVLAAAAFGGLKGYLHYRYTGLVDDAIRNASPLVDIRYSDLSVTLDGELIIEEITITPRGEFQDTIRVGSIRFTTPGLKYLVSSGDRVERGEFPSHLRLAVRGIEIPPDGFIMASLEKMTDVRNKELKGRIAPMCGDVQHLGPRQYQELGYGQLTSDLSLGYEFDEAAQVIRVALTWVTPGLGSASLTVDLKGFAAPSIQAMMMKGPPVVSRVELAYQDDSYVSRALKYCAAKRQMTVEQLIAIEVRREPRYYAVTWGIVPGKPMLKAYERFLKSPGEVRLIMYPDSVEDMATLQQYRKEDLPSLLNMQLLVNGEDLEDLSFREASVSLVEGRRPRGTSSDGKQTTSTKPGSRQLPRARYHAVRISELSRHIGRNVRIHTVDGPVREGRLSGVKAGIIHARSLKYRGKVEFMVPVSRAKRIEVFYAKAN